MPLETIDEETVPGRFWATNRDVVHLSVLQIDLFSWCVLLFVPGPVRQIGPKSYAVEIQESMGPAGPVESYHSEKSRCNFVFPPVSLPFLCSCSFFTIKHVDVGSLRLKIVQHEITRDMRRYTESISILE